MRSVGGGDPLSVRKPWGVINFVFTLKRFLIPALKIDYDIKKVKCLTIFGRPKIGFVRTFRCASGKLIVNNPPKSSCVKRQLPHGKPHQVPKHPPQKTLTHPVPRRRGAVTHGSSWTEDNTQDYISGSPLLKGGGGPPMIFPGHVNLR